MIADIKCLPEVQEDSYTKLSLINCFAYEVDNIEKILLGIFISLEAKLLRGYKFVNF